MIDSNVVNFKLEHCKKELKALLLKLIEANYNLTAQAIYDHIANSGVEMDLNPSLKDKKSMDEFLAED